MKSNVGKILTIVVACIPSVAMAIVETIGNISNEAKMEDFESRIAALENKKESE